MSELVLEDKILYELLGDRNYRGTSNLAATLNCSEQEIVEAIEKIHKEDPAMIVIKPGYGDNAYDVVLRKPEKIVKLFLDSGGFTLYRRKIESEMQQLKVRQELELNKLRLEVDELKQRPLERKSTRRLAIAALVVSILSLLIELLKNFVF